MSNNTNPETKRQALMSNVVLIQRQSRQPLMINIVTTPETKKTGTHDQYSTPETKKTTATE